MDKFSADPINETENIAMEEVEEQRDLIVPEELDQEAEEETKSEPESLERARIRLGCIFVIFRTFLCSPDSRK